jgi:hypothetical protein
MRRDRRFAGRLLRVCEPFEERKDHFTFEFEFRGGFGRSLGWILPGLLYTRKRGRCWFFTLPFALAFFFGFCNLREQTEKKGNHPPHPFRLHRLHSAMADKVTVLPPRDLWPFSTIAVEDLETLVADGLLRRLSDGLQPEWMAPSSEADPTPPPGFVLSFIPFHEWGFGVPASRSRWALLHHYGVELHNLNPNSITQAAIFAVVCEGFLGIDPHWDLWTHLFSVEFFVATTKVKKVRMAVRAGGCTLQMRLGRAQQYIPATLASSNKGWQNRWFYLWNNGGMLLPFSQRVVTTAGTNWRWGATREKQETLQPIL